MDFACTMMVQFEGFGLERWRVRVSVEIGDGGLEGEEVRDRALERLARVEIGLLRG